MASELSSSEDVFRRIRQRMLEVFHCSVVLPQVSEVYGIIMKWSNLASLHVLRTWANSWTTTSRIRVAGSIPRDCLFCSRSKSNAVDSSSVSSSSSSDSSGKSSSSSSSTSSSSTSSDCCPSDDVAHYIACPLIWRAVKLMIEHRIPALSSVVAFEDPATRLGFGLLPIT